MKGVIEVEEGFIATKDRIDDFSEAVIVHFDKKIIGLKDLIEIHLNTHKSSKNHSMPDKYRSAIYYFEASEEVLVTNLISELQKKFTSSEECFQNYYFKDTNKPFCKTHITPKIILLKERFSEHVATKV